MLIKEVQNFISAVDELNRTYPEQAAGAGDFIVNDLSLLPFLSNKVIQAFDRIKPNSLNEENASAATEAALVYYSFIDNVKDLEVYAPRGGGLIGSVKDLGLFIPLFSDDPSQEEIKAYFKELPPPPPPPPPKIPQVGDWATYEELKPFLTENKNLNPIPNGYFFLGVSSPLNNYKGEVFKIPLGVNVVLVTTGRNFINFSGGIKVIPFPQGSDIQENGSYVWPVTSVIRGINNNDIYLGNQDPNVRSTLRLVSGNINSPQEEEEEEYIPPEQTFFIIDNFLEKDLRSYDV